MKLPSFMIVGAAKSGTTSLYAYLKQHPQIFFTAPKEPTFFGNEGSDGLFRGPGDEDRSFHTRVITSFPHYASGFAGVTDQRAVGDASIYSLYLPNAPAQIKKYIPNATMFAVLRHPADRAYSAYLHTVRQGREQCSFGEALLEEPRRIAENWNPLWHYRSMGLYSAQVKRFLNLFGREQMHFYLYEDFQQAPLPLMKTIFEILDVNSSFVPNTTERYKVAFVPRNRALERVVRKGVGRLRSAARHVPQPFQAAIKGFAGGIDRLAEWNRQPPPTMAPEFRDSLVASYRDDILRLQDLLRRDLSQWFADSTLSPQKTAARPALPGSLELAHR